MFNRVVTHSSFFSFLLDEAECFYQSLFALQARNIYASKQDCEMNQGHLLHTNTHAHTHTHFTKTEWTQDFAPPEAIDCRGEHIAWNIDDAFCLNEIEDSIPGKFCTIGFLISHQTTFVGSSFLFQYIVTPCMTHQNLLKQGRHCNKMNRIQ